MQSDADWVAAIYLELHGYMCSYYKYSLEKQAVSDSQAAAGHAIFGAPYM